MIIFKRSPMVSTPDLPRPLTVQITGPTFMPRQECDSEDCRLNRRRGELSCAIENPLMLHTVLLDT